MRSTVQSLLVGVILAIGTAAAVAAPPAVNPVIGTWKLNVEKSTFSPGPALKAQIRSYAASAPGMTVTLQTTAADGKKTTTTVTFTDDGTLYAAPGNPDYDTVSAQRVDALTSHSTQIKAGAVVGTGLRTVSKDGKTLTFAQKGTHANGVSYDNVLVYDQQ